MDMEITCVTHVPVVLIALGERPHPLYAQKAHILGMDQPYVHYAPQVKRLHFGCTYERLVNLNVIFLIVGHMCPNSGQEPIECPVGFYSVGNTTICLTCPAGYTCLSTSTIPVACSLGYYSLEGNANCTQCEAGYACEDSKSPPRSCDPGMLV